MQFLSEKMSRHLSSLAPGFEGHWWWTYPYLNAPHAEVVCYEDLNISVKICPAWQVEDLLRNLRNFPPLDSLNRDVMKELIEYLVYFPDTAYQKIEEYLWGILK